MSVPAGWYPDSQLGVMRYWDGTAWTQHTSEPAARPVSQPLSRVEARRQTASTGARFWQVAVLCALSSLFTGVVTWYFASGTHERIGKETHPQITYRITGYASSAHFIYNDNDGQTSLNGPVPWVDKNNKPFDVSFIGHANQYLYVTAMLRDVGNVQCHILVNGVEVSSDSAFDRFGVATCSARA